MSAFSFPPTPSWAGRHRSSMLGSSEVSTTVSRINRFGSLRMISHATRKVLSVCERLRLRKVRRAHHCSACKIRRHAPQYLPFFLLLRSYSLPADTLHLACNYPRRRYPHRHRTRRVLLDIIHAAGILIDIVLVASFLISSTPPESLGSSIDSAISLSPSAPLSTESLAASATPCTP